MQNHTQETQQFLTFAVGGEEYAVSILKVREIIEFGIVTVVPNTPPWMRGVINLRGSVIPVVDLAVKFGLPASQAGKLSCVVILEVATGDDALVLGVLTDSVSQVLDFTADDIKPTPSFGTRVKPEYLLGMGVVGEKFNLILDVDKVLSVDELVAVEDSLEADGAVAISTGSLPAQAEA